MSAVKKMQAEYDVCKPTRPASSLSICIFVVYGLSAVFCAELAFAQGELALKNPSLDVCVGAKKLSVGG